MKSKRWNLLNQALVFGATLLTMSTQAAVLTEWGVETWAETAYCTIGCTNYLGEVDTRYNAPNADSYYQDNRGLAMAEAAFAGELDEPELRAYAMSQGENYVAIATSRAVQRYTYTGSGTRSFTLNVDYHGIFDTSSADSRMYAETAIIKPGNDFNFHYGLGTILGETDSVGLAVEYLYENAFGEHTYTHALDFEMSSGESIYLWTRMDLKVVDGDSIDALNTVSMSFSDNTGLLSAQGSLGEGPDDNVSVPDTSAIILMAIFGLALPIRRRLKK